MPVQVDLVVPFYNPSGDWTSRLVQGFNALKEGASGYELRLILVDDGSPDDKNLADGIRSLEEAELPFTLFRSATNKGKGHALREGIGKSVAPFVLFTDVDLPYTIESMLKIIAALDQGADIALGYRMQDYYASVPWFRKGMSEMFRFVLQRVMHFPITDTQCGLKGMNRRGREVFLSTVINRFLVDMDFIKRAVKQGDLRVEPVVVKLRNDVVFSRMGPGVIIREALNFARILLH